MEKYPEEITTTDSTPETDNLFKVLYEKDRIPPNEKKASQFHHAVAHILFAIGRVRWDLQMSVAFITTRVKAPDKDDWRKLKQFMKYIMGVLGVKLTLRSDSLFVIKWWLYESFAMHNDRQGHTGGIMSLGSGSITGVS